MNSSKLSEKKNVRPSHKKVAPLHLEVRQPTDNPRANTAESAPVVFPLRLPPRARSYSKSDLATAANMFMKLKRGDDIRHEKVASIREALAHEDYESAMKVELVVLRLLDEMNPVANG